METNASPSNHDPLQLCFAPGVEYIWLRFMPYNGSYLVRMIPVARFVDMIKRGEMIQVSQAVVGLMRNDHVVVAPIGALHLQPLLETAYRQPGQHSRRVEIMASWVDRDGEPRPECARNKIQELCAQLEERHVRVLAGFEIEVVLMPLDSSTPAEPKANDHGWCTMTAQDRTTMDAVEAIVSALRVAGVDLQQFHAESGLGQWEFVLGPRPPLQAVDILVRAREVIAVTAQTQGFRATLHPRPYPQHAGTGAHAHISANGPLAEDGEVDASTAASFFGGILAHLPAIAAFTLPLDASYERVKASIWSGGEWVCWGTQNRETPLRRVSRGRFEVKSICGTANPYLAVSAILAAGLDGIEQSSTLPGDCCEDPALLSQEQREELGITVRLPRTVDESLAALKEDVALCHKLGSCLVEPYVTVTRTWNSYLRDMSPPERHRLLLSRY